MDQESWSCLGCNDFLGRALGSKLPKSTGPQMGPKGLIEAESGSLKVIFSSFEIHLMIPISSKINASCMTF